MDTNTTKTLRCEMTRDCESPVAYIDNKGYIYCREHGLERRDWRPCRQLRPYELSRLRKGLLVERY